MDYTHVSEIPLFSSHLAAFFYSTLNSNCHILFLFHLPPNTSTRHQYAAWVHRSGKILMICLSVRLVSSLWLYNTIPVPLTRSYSFYFSFLCSISPIVSFLVIDGHFIYWCRHFRAYYSVIHYFYFTAWLYARRRILPSIIPHFNMLNLINLPP